MRVPGQWREQRPARGRESRERTCGKAMAGEELGATVCREKGEELPSGPS